MSAHRRTPRRADLSQHFLRKATAKRLIKGTSISGTDLVIEIGAGRGALTKPLADRTSQVLAVECDNYLAEKLKQELGARISIINSDFLTVPLPGQPFKVIGNIPFSITTEILRKLVETPTPPIDAWLVVQQELAYRFCGFPYSNETLWSLKLKPFWHVEIVDRLKRTDFDPPPSVDAVLLWLSYRGQRLLTTKELKLYLEVINAAYANVGNIKKVVRQWLSKTQIRRLARDFYFDESSMSSTLRFEQWLGIVRFIARQRLG